MTVFEDEYPNVSDKSGWCVIKEPMYTHCAYCSLNLTVNINIDFSFSSKTSCTNTFVDFNLYYLIKPKQVRRLG